MRPTAELTTAAETKRTNRRFAFLFALLVLAFVLLAYRSEVNSNELKQQQQVMERSFYEACLKRQDRQTVANVGREAMVQIALASPGAPADTAGRTLMEQQLRDALLLPVENCGEPPV